MLPKDAKSSKNHFHKGCASFTSKKPKVVVSDDSKKTRSKKLYLAQSSRLIVNNKVFHNKNNKLGVKKRFKF